MRFYELICETQISNAEGIARFMATQSREPTVQKWIYKRAMQIMGAPDFSSAHMKPVSLDELDGREEDDGPGEEAPEWQRRAAEKNELYHLGAVPEFGESMRNIADYFNHLKQADPPVFSRIDRMTFEQADAAQKQWHAQLAKKVQLAPRADVAGVQEVMKVDGLTWVKLSSPEALKDEGNAMGHCVGDYADDVGQGVIEIYSLRDAKNMPHITVEVFRGMVEQVKAKGNARCPPKYAKAVLELVNAHPTSKWTKWEWYDGGVNDMSESGLAYAKGSFYPYMDVATKIADYQGNQVYALPDLDDSKVEFRIVGGTTYAMITIRSDAVQEMGAEAGDGKMDFALLTDLMQGDKLLGRPSGPETEDAFRLVLQLRDFLGAHGLRWDASFQRHLNGYSDRAGLYRLDGEFLSPDEYFSRQEKKLAHLATDRKGLYYKGYVAILGYGTDYAHSHPELSKRDIVQRIAGLIGVQTKAPAYGWLLSELLERKIIAPPGPDFKGPVYKADSFKGAAEPE